MLSRLAQRTCLLMLTKFDKCIQMSMNHQVCFSRYVSFRNPFSAVATWIFRSRYSVGSAQTELLRAPAGTAGLRWGSGARASRRSLRGRSLRPHPEKFTLSVFKLACGAQSNYHIICRPEEPFGQQIPNESPLPQLMLACNFLINMVSQH